jgi:hypothetical protein
MSGTAHFPFCAVLWGLTYPWFFLFSFFFFLFPFLSFLLSFGAKNAYLFPLFFFLFFMRVLAAFQVSQISNTKEKGVSVEQ